MYLNVHSIIIHDARTWKRPKASAADDWRHRIKDSHAREFYLAIKSNVTRRSNVTWINPENALREGSNTKATCCTIPFTRNVQNKPVHRYRIYVSDLQGLGRKKQERLLISVGSKIGDDGRITLLICENS